MATARPRHGSCQTLITLTRRPVTRALHVLSSRVLCLALPAVDLLEALDRGVCTRRACCSVCVYRTSAASVELLPRGWRAVAFPRWLHDQISSSTWLIVIIIVRHCFGGLCVRDRLAACLRTSHFYAASVEPLPRGSRAVAFPRWLQVLSCSTWHVAHRSLFFFLLHQLLCFGFIGANSNV